MRKLFFLLTLMLMGTAIGRADDISFEAAGPDAVVSGEQFRVAYTINTQSVRDFRAPSFDGFHVLMGPSSSRQSSVSIVNGKRTSTSSITYTFILEAIEPGTHRIPGASIVAGGKSALSNALTIKVLPPDEEPQGGTGRQASSANAQGGTAPAVTASQLFVVPTVSKTTVYEQEAFLVTFKVYTTLDLRNFGFVKAPDFNGFHAQEVELPQTKTFSMDHYKGRNYRTLVWSQYVLFPQRSGQLEIPACEFEAVVAQAVATNDPFEAFFNGGGYVQSKKRISSPKVPIQVRPLPAGKPASFGGAVGSFTLASTASPLELKSNEALTLKLTLSGTGNLKLITPPDVKFPSDFEVYDPKVDTQSKLTQNGLSGQKVFEYLAIPRHAGEYTIPAVEFTFFDPKSQKYQTLTSESYRVQVAKGDGQGTAGQVVSDYSNKEEVKVLGNDIRFIKTGETRYRQRDNFWVGTWSYRLAYLLPILLFLLAAWMYRKRLADAKGGVQVRMRKANKVATRRLKGAGRLLAAGKKDAFYDEVLKALWGYVADKLNIPVAQLSKDTVETELARRGADEALIRAFLDALGQCEYARYAPGDENKAMDQVYEAASSVIGQMENAMKK